MSTPAGSQVALLTIRQEWMDDDDEDGMMYERLLDLGLAFDGHDPDDLEDHANAQDGQECAQDGAGDGDGAEDEAEELDPLGHPKQAWCVILAERDAAGEWRTVGEPVADAVFDDMSTAHAWAENRNKRHFGLKFDWANDPPKAWITARVGQVGAVRVNQPLPLPAVEADEDKPMVADLDEELEQDDDAVLADWEQCGAQ